MTASTASWTVSQEALPLLPGLFPRRQSQALLPGGPLGAPGEAVTELGKGWSGEGPGSSRPGSTQGKISGKQSSWEELYGKNSTTQGRRRDLMLLAEAAERGAVETMGDGNRLRAAHRLENMGLLARMTRGTWRITRRGRSVAGSERMRPL